MTASPPPQLGPYYHPSNTNLISALSKNKNKNENHQFLILVPTPGLLSVIHMTPSLQLKTLKLETLRRRKKTGVDRALVSPGPLLPVEPSEHLEEG